MGRGLGDLQKAVLRLALIRLEREPGSYRIVDLSASDVLEAHYGFPVSGKPANRFGSAIVFDRRTIGVSRYMAASVTVSQCFGRLARRGLVVRVPGRGVRLTEAGVRVTNTIS